MSRNGMELDHREWQQAVRSVLRETDKEAADVVNRSMASIIYRAPYSLIRKTYRQTKAGVTRDIKRRGDMIYEIATKWLARTGSVINEQTVAAAAQRIVAARQKSVKYIVAGWAPAARVFGATRIRQPGGKSKAAQGGGDKATPSRLTATATNAVGREIQDANVYRDSQQSIDVAVSKEAEDLTKRLDERLARVMGRHSGGRA